MNEESMNADNEGRESDHDDITMTNDVEYEFSGDENSADSSFIPVTRDEAFVEDQWELVEEDVCLMDLQGLLEPEYLQKCDKNKIKILGLVETEKPIIQVDQYVFQGEASRSSTSQVLFKVHDVDPDDESDDQIVSDTRPGKITSNKRLSYFCTTQNKYIMNSLFLGKKESASTS